MSVPFVGRHDELEAIRGLISRARRESAPVVGLISGAPGTGKSRLLHEALSEVDPKRLVAVTGFEPIQPVPLAAVSDLVRRLQVVPDHGRRLQEVAFGSPEVGGPGSLQVFEAVHRAAAAFGPLVLAVDDLQRIDAQSLALIYYLVTAAESSRRPISVIAASRRSPVAATFADAIAGLLPNDRGYSGELRGLTLDDGVTLAQAIDGSFDQATAESLWRRADGSPFWLEALARGRPSTDAADLVIDRVRTLSSDAGRLMSVLAIVARPNDHDELAAFIGWDADRLDHAVRELVGRGLALDEVGSIRLTHDLIREAAASAIPRATRQTLHARLADHLERSVGEDLPHLAEALDHRAAAGLPTAPLARRIVASPQRRLLGAGDLRRLSLIADSLPAGSAEQREIDEGIARLAVELGERERAIRHWGRVATTTDDPVLRQRAHVEAARAGYEGGHPADVHRHLAEARSLPLDAVTAIDLDAIEAQVRLWDENDSAGGVAAASRAVMRSREVIAAAGGAGNVPLQARPALLGAFVAGLEAAQQEERVEELIELGATALAMADGIGEDARLSALTGVAFGFHIVGRLADAEERYREAWDAAQRLMLPRWMVEASYYLAHVLIARGRLLEAKHMAREVEALQARIRPWLWGEMSQTVLHLTELSLGEPGAVERVRSSMQGMVDHFRIEIHEALAIWIARQEGARHDAGVERELDAAGDASRAIGCPFCARVLDAVSAEALARIGRVDDATRALAAYEAGYSGPTYPARRLLAARARASIAIESESPAALEALDELERAIVEVGKPVEGIWARIDRGHVLRRRGDRYQAIGAYTDAASLAHSIGAAGLERIASRALRELGVRAWRRGAAPRGDGVLAVLSHREREIAGLVAAGHSNQEVADTLVLARKTVERHVTNILAKLGARNRTELASFVHSESQASETRIPAG
jgi:DNA-binding CsgD family transcriptional regulator